MKNLGQIQESRLILVNHTEISGEVTKVYPLAHTLLGIPIVSFVIKHESEQVEANNSRIVRCQLYCVMLDIERKFEENIIGRIVTVSGFLSYNAKDKLVLNVKTINIL